MVIYKITNLINNKVYIGKTISDRLDYFGSGIIIKNSIKKYGIENFKKEIIDETLSVKELNEKEIEIEVRNFKELQEVLDHGGIDRIMLDNFTPADLKQAIEMISGKYETEASGGINLQTIRSFAETGVDYISVGALTHQIKSLDLSLIAIK